MSTEPARLTWTDRERLDPDSRAGLLGPGAIFELAPADVHGHRLETFVQAPTSLAQLVANAAHHGDKPFLVSDEREITFDALPDVVARRAGALGSRGIRAGDRVLLAGEISIDHSITALAVGWLGAVLATVNPRSTSHELAHAVELTTPALAVVDAGVGARLPDGLDAITFDALADADGDPIEAASDVDGDAAAVIIFTSGTTGQAKGAALSGRGLGHFLFASALSALTKRILDPPEGGGGSGANVAIACSPMFHVSGLLGQLLNALAWGMTLAYPPPGRWDPTTHLEVTERHGVTMWSLVPTQLQRLIDHPDLDRYDLSTLEGVGGGGATFSPELVRRVAQRLPDVRPSVRIGYGMTESAGLLTIRLPPFPEHHLASVGGAAAGCEVEIRDEDGTPLGEDEVGEIWARSAGLFIGYWNDPEATAAAFDDDGWYRTGDYGRIRDGALFLESRLRDMIIRGGENVYPIEIENRLCEHPAVADAAVVGVPHDDLGEEVKAVVELQDGAAVEADELRSWCAETLARHKVPAHVEVRTLPRNDVGKVLKRDL